MATRVVSVLVAWCAAAVGTAHKSPYEDAGLPHSERFKVEHLAVRQGAGAVEETWNVGEDAFNEAFRQCPCVRFTFLRDDGTNATLVYNRITPFSETFDPYQLFVTNFQGYPADPWRLNQGNDTNDYGTDFVVYNAVDSLLDGGAALDRPQGGCIPYEQWLIGFIGNVGFPGPLCSGQLLHLTNGDKGPFFALEFYKGMGAGTRSLSVHAPDDCPSNIVPAPAPSTSTPPSPAPRTGLPTTATPVPTAATWTATDTPAPPLQGDVGTGVPEAPPLPVTVEPPTPAPPSEAPPQTQAPQTQAPQTHIPEGTGQPALVIRVAADDEDGEESSDSAAAVVTGTLVGQYALQVALGGSLVIPVHALTMLQVLYLAANEMASASALAGKAAQPLRLVVFPAAMNVTADHATNRLAFTVSVHAAITVLHLGAVGIAYALAATPRRWKAAAATALFPNGSLVIFQCFIVPIIAGVTRAEWGAVPVAASVYLVALTVGFVWLYHHLHAKRLSVSPPYAEYLTVNLNNTAANATTALQSEGKRCLLPCGIREWLPHGYWSSQHLMERDFMRRYSILLSEYSPASVAVYPFLLFTRLYVLTGLAWPGHAGATWRLCIMAAVAVATTAGVAVSRPFSCAGNNVVACVMNVCFAAALLVTVDWADVADFVVPVFFMLAVVFVCSFLWYVLAWVVTWHLIRAEAAKARDAGFAPGCAKLLAAGMVQIAVLPPQPNSNTSPSLATAVSSEDRPAAARNDGSDDVFDAVVAAPPPEAEAEAAGDGDAMAASMSGSRQLYQKWCELRGPCLAVFDSSAEEHAGYRADVDLHTAEFFPADATVEDDERPAAHGVMFAGTGLHAGMRILMYFKTRAEREQWECAVHKGTVGSGAFPATGADAAAATPGILDPDVVRIPKVDRLHLFHLFGDPIRTSCGEYRHGTLRKPAASTWRRMPVPGGAYSEGSGSGDDAAEEHLLLHGVAKKALSAQQVNLWTAELVVLAHLRHPALLPVTNAFETGAKLFWAVPHCPLGSLAAHLEAHGVLSEATAARHTAELLLGLEHLHANNLVFRNLAPSDVLIQDNGTLCLSDPGLPWAPARPEKTCYASPEVLSGCTAQPASDVWALGVIVYEMLHGAKAFNGATKEACARLILNTTPAIAAKLSSAAKEVLQRLLAKAPADRPAAGQVKSFQWFAKYGVEWDDVWGRDGTVDSSAAAPVQEKRRARRRAQRSMSPVESSPGSDALSAPTTEPFDVAPVGVNPLMAMFPDSCKAGPGGAEQSPRSPESPESPESPGSSRALLCKAAKPERADSSGTLDQSMRTARSGGFLSAQHGKNTSAQSLPTSQLRSQRGGNSSQQSLLTAKSKPQRLPSSASLATTADMSMSIAPSMRTKRMQPMLRSNPSMLNMSVTARAGRLASSASMGTLAMSMSARPPVMPQAASVVDRA